jgi:hypothetical protein
MYKIINKYKMYLKPVHMFRQITCHPQGILSRNFKYILHSNTQMLVLSYKYLRGLNILIKLKTKAFAFSTHHLLCKLFPQDQSFYFLTTS